MAKQAITDKDVQAAEGLIAFIEACPSMFHTAHEIAQRLDKAGFTYLAEGDAWQVAPGGSYYTQRNGSSIIAWKVGEHALDEAATYHFQLAAAHSDAPTFKLKARPVLAGPEGQLRLDVEAYGGMIDYTWFDRPLSLAGRVLVRTEAGVESRLIALDQDIALIPSLAVHLNREVNAGFAPNRAQDLCPLITAGALTGEDLDACIAQAAHAAPHDVLARDLFLVCRQRPCVWGAAREFVSAPKLDDLMCAYTALTAFMAAQNPHAVTVFACFDNEEVGSNTKQGAMSTLLADTLSRLTAALGLTSSDYRRALASSMLVSCDNAHAVHPNHPEKYDEANRCHLNGGLAIKEAANQHYCTDAFSRAVFMAVCDRAGVPYQTFANRSDMAGGSTLGNLSNIQASMHAVDVGCPQLAMHSAFETAGTADVALATRALEAFFSADLAIEGAARAQIA